MGPVAPGGLNRYPHPFVSPGLQNITWSPATESPNSTKTARSGRETAQKRRLHVGDAPPGELKFLSIYSDTDAYRALGRHKLILHNVDPTS